jgi:BMFP domain-containing protein YqiC
MKRTVLAWIAVMTLATAGAQAQSLGDYARNVRKSKEQTPASSKKYDNDNLPREEKLSIVGPAPAEPAEAATATGEQPAAAETEEKTEGAAKPSEVKPGQTAEERQQVYTQWKDKIAAQKNQLDLLSRELDVAQREYRLRAAAFYADAGNRMRNAAAWDKEDAQYKQQIADKQKAVEAAKQQLQSLQDQARKAGVPNSMRE